ncbi:hypothetical protein JHK84_044874 [Glycine max]|nr:hypothetical protein JHK84_044874 [Glycine max]
MRKKEKGRGYREAGRNVKEVARKGDRVYRKRVASKRAHQGPTVLAARPAAVSSATNDGVSVGNAHDNRRRRSLARRQQTSRRRTRETDERRTRETGERRMTHATVTRDRRMTHDDGSVLPMNVTDAAMKAAKKGQNEGAMPNVAIKTAEKGHTEGAKCCN